MSALFHLAFPIRDIEETRRFYAEVLGCGVGRETDRWIDFDFFGHQISAHVNAEECRPGATSPVDGVAVPLRHFGAVLDRDRWLGLAERVRAAGIEFVIEPQIRYPGKTGEQGTFFIRDPAGNGLEFKFMRDPAELYTRQMEPA